MNAHQLRRLEVCRAQARLRGGECLSSEYNCVRDRLRWRCAEGHEWETTPMAIRSGRWCFTCSLEARDAKKKARVFTRVQALAEAKGGRCLSTEYVNVKTPLRFRCAEDHEWCTTPTSISNGSWCPCCSGLVMTIDDMHKLARSLGGRCLSAEHVDGAVHVRWRCSEGHEWRATASTIRGGSWCPDCAKAIRITDKMRVLIQLQGLAREMGGLCLATEYLNNRTKMRFRCAEGHEWSSTPAGLKRGHWCRICARAAAADIERAQTLVRVKEIAHAKGGRCLAKEYAVANSYLRWSCAEGHEWDAKPTWIQQGRWCPDCDLILRIGGKKAEAFARVKEIAVDRGGCCITTEYEGKRTRMRWRCAEGHEWEATQKSIVAGSWCPRCIGRLVTIEDMQVMASGRGGRCLSDLYVGNWFYLRWQCGEGHEWTATPTTLQQGSWCPYCSGKARKTIEDVQAMAAERGGECLSTTMQTTFDLLRFRCRAGHEFESKAAYVRSGRWCPRCGVPPRGTLKRLQGVVERRGGVLLDNEYHNSLTRVRVRCAEGHEWLVTPASLLEGSWCQVCMAAAKRGQSFPRLSLVDMQVVAESRGGRCISETYVNCDTHLRWQCRSGHEWEAKPASIRRGSWCPICARRLGSIDGMRAIAVEHGGTCDSSTYETHKDMLHFTCADGHRFMLTGRSVKSGVWCPTCEQRDTPESEYLPGYEPTHARLRS